MNPLDQIKSHQAAIVALTTDAVQALKEQRADLTSGIRSIDRQIAELTGRTPEKKPRKKRKGPVLVSLVELMNGIKYGHTNALRLANWAGCSSAQVRKVIASDGADLITSTGSRRNFAYALK